MKKFTIYLMILAAALAAGCNKVAENVSASGARSFVDEIPEGAMLFNVNLGDIKAKSHFEEDASTTEGETARLEWDEDDDLGVIAVKLLIDGGELVGADFAGSKCGLARIKSLGSDGDALF